MVVVKVIIITALAQKISGIQFQKPKQSLGLAKFFWPSKKKKNAIQSYSEGAQTQINLIQRHLLGRFHYFGILKSVIFIWLFCNIVG